MGYYKGSNFLRANKRWFGIPGGGPSKKSLYECSYVKGADGYYYYWAPSYRSAIFGLIIPQTIFTIRLQQIFL